MKIILSRKGFDSANGRQPNPIMPDGTLLSLPIPDPKGNNTFSSLHWNGMSFYDIIKSLRPRTTLNEDGECHLDPDLRENVRNRLPGWKPAFGQAGAALTHLENKNVGVGDLFLFFGWFKETEINQGRLVYKKKAKDLHIIYGYMQIGEMIERKADAYDWLKDHPHIADNNDREDGKNTIYLSTDKFSFMPNVNGCGILDFRKDRVLTKEGMSRGKWDLPSFFKNVEISYHPDPWKCNYFQSAAIGQEFVIDATPEIMDWTRHIIE